MQFNPIIVGMANATPQNRPRRHAWGSYILVAALSFCAGLLV